MSAVVDVKPWGPESDMSMVSEKMKAICSEHAGVVLDGIQLVPVAFGVSKAQLRLEADSSDQIEALCECLLEELEDSVQSVDWERV